MGMSLSLLRGVNVGGHHEIKMAAVKALYESIGLTGVTTYIRSGNIIFQSPHNNSGALETLLEQSIAHAFGLDITVIIRSPAQLLRTVNKNPYAERGGIDLDRLAVSFLKSSPVPERVRTLRAIALKNHDEFTLAGDAIYLHCPDGFAKTQLTGTFFERHLGVHVTARNWKTTRTLLELCQSRKA